MPRTTLDLDATVLRDLKRRSREERKPLGTLASELLAPLLHGSHRGAGPEPFEWDAGPMGARVDLEDDEALEAAMRSR